MYGKGECAMTALENDALERLRSYGDPACHEQMVQAILRGKADVLASCESGVLTFSRHEGFYMIAGPDALALLERVPQGAQDVVIHGTRSPETIEAAKTKTGLKDANRFVLYAYYGELPPEETEAEIRPLGMESLDFIYQNYGHASKEYLAERIEDGVMIGAYVDGKLAAFIGEHAEGAMGLLHVMPEYRRHHLGYKLELADIRRTMLAGQTPFCQVFPENTASHHLQERLCMTRSQGDVYWLCSEEL